MENSGQGASKLASWAYADPLLDDPAQGLKGRPKLSWVAFAPTSRRSRRFLVSWFAAGARLRGERRKGPSWSSTSKEFIEFMVESEVLKFGEFTLKSGRKSPFFMNAGRLRDGRAAAPKTLVLRAPSMILLGWTSTWCSVGVQGHSAVGDHGHRLAGAVRQGSALLLQPQGSQDHGADAGNLLGSELHDGDRVIMVEETSHVRQVHR